MAEFVIGTMTEADFSKAIDTCRKQEKLLKDKEVKRKKYADMRAKFEKGKEEYKKAIEQAKKTKVKIGGEEKSFYDEFIKGKESTLTLVKIHDLKETHKPNITPETLAEAEKIADSDIIVSTHVDFIDDIKQVGHDILHGKGLGKGIMTVSAGLFISELLTQGITSYLVQNGVMQSSMGLLGLGQLGIQALPGALQGITSALTSFAGWSSVAAITGGVFAVAAVIPLITNAVKKVQAKHKEAHSFEDNMNKLAAEQAART